MPKSELCKPLRQWDVHRSLSSPTLGSPDQVWIGSDPKISLVRFSACEVLGTVLCMVGAYTSIVPEPSAGKAWSQRSPREGSRVSRLCWPGRIN